MIRRKFDRLAIDRITSRPGRAVSYSKKSAYVRVFACCCYALCRPQSRVVKALVKYTASAEVSGDYDHVVGYARIIIS